MSPDRVGIVAALAIVADDRGFDDTELLTDPARADP
jgi:hypothetical protein